jgi:hypothetical protein
MKKLNILLILAVILFLSQFNSLQTQWQIPGNTEVIPDIFSNQNGLLSYHSPITKTPGHYSVTDWRHAIDSVWGAGLSTAEKLQLFDNFWNRIDSAFACFHDNPVNWDSLKQLYRPEVAAGVSRGRFAAIMGCLSIALKEGHTKAFDNVVSNSTLYPGIPLMIIGGWGENKYFGAGLTPLPDSSLLVYSVIPNHPLGLQRGDIILGYDGIPWKVLVYQLLSYQLPLAGWWGCSPGAYTHSLLMAAGRNWHLFDTIDIVKYGTGITVHLPTSLLEGLSTSLFCTEQMDIAGVPKPNFYAGEFFSYGIVQGTNIGYIYGWQYSGNAGQQFYNAVQALMQTDGLIIDFRTNFGGIMYLSDSALKVLFNYTTATVDFGTRCNPTNHLQMCAQNGWSYYKINGVPPGYNKPIAMLTGPGAMSSGDQVALRMKYHPRVKIFGKSTSTAFNSPVSLNVNPDWNCRYSPYDAFELSNPGRYLTHIGFPVDQNVWLTPQLVAQGRDDVVEAALSWLSIFSGTGTTLLTDNAEGGFGNWVTDQGWGVIRSNAHSPVNSFTDSPKGNYKNNANNSMTLKNPVNASGTDALVLSFWQKYAVQLDKDYCRVEVSSDNGTTWQQAISYTGTVSTIHQVQIDITKYANRSSNVKVRFRLTSDASGVADGWYVDDILITGYTHSGQTVTGVNENNTPYKYSLNQNYPNPFNPTTKINYQLPITNYVKLSIYDMLGREITVLVNEKQSAGTYGVKWDASNYPSGVYFYKLTAGEFSQTNKMILIK